MKTKEEKLECLAYILENKNHNYSQEVVFKKNFSEFYNDLITWVFPSDFSFKQKIYHYLNDDVKLQLGICPICGSRCRFKQITTGYNTYCSLKCSNVGKGETISKTKLGKTQEEKNLIEEKKRSTLKSKYGDNYREIIGTHVSDARNNFSEEKWNEIHEKYKLTCLEKYGKQSFSQTEEFKSAIQNNTERTEKIKQTCLERYGVENPMQSEEVKEKSKQTCLNRYGKEWVSQVDEIKNLQQKNYALSCIKKYGVNNTSKLPHVRKKISKAHSNKFIEKYNGLIIAYDNENYVCKCNCSTCNKCTEKVFTIDKSLFKNRIKYNLELCTILNPKGQYSISQPQIKLTEFISSIYDGKIEICNRTVLNGKELDIYLPEKKIAFEFNGIYWHSELFKDKMYHQEKSKLCLEKGIQLIHIWEDDWFTHHEILKDLIKTKLGLNKNKLYARKLTIKEISQSECSNFLNKYHLQGSINSSIRIGLFNDDELVEVLTFGKKRNFMKSKSISNSEYELYRLCTKAGVTVIGGFSKLLKYFIRNYNPSEIITYASLDISNANVYKLNGFKLDSVSKPDYYWVVDGIRQHRFKFRKDILVKNGADKNKSEFEIMSEQGYYRIFGSGNYKLKYINGNI